MTGSTSLSVLVPLAAPGSAADAARDAIEKYLQTTGFTFEIRTPEADTYGDALRRGVSEATGDVIVIVDPELPYAVSAIGDAVAMIESGGTDVVFGTIGAVESTTRLLYWLLVPEVPDLRVGLKAFTSMSAKLAIGETKLDSVACDLEIAFLVNRYGFRLERLSVDMSDAARRRSIGFANGVAAAVRIRMIDRRMGYRAPRRCPVCFSSEVRTHAQISGKVIRACRRCKCRYINQFYDISDDALSVRRVLRPHAPPAEIADELHSDTSRSKTAARRLNLLRKQLTSHARVLEIGVRDGTFGVAAAREFEYVGIDPAPAVARHARSVGLEVYCATVANFVNTGPSFDAVVMLHVFAKIADPHDALARIKDLLKPGGVLMLTTTDSESLVYMLTERKRLAQSFSTRLIVYSRSSLVELLEHSGFEIDVIGPDLEYRDQKVLSHWIGGRWPALARFLRLIFPLLPDPVLTSSGAIRIVAKRRVGAPVNPRGIRSVEPTHAR